VRAEVGIPVHHVDECALDEIGELERAAELPVTLDAFVHRAGDLDAQRSEFLRGFELEQSHGDLPMTWRQDVDRADCSNGAANSKLAVLIGDVETVRVLAAESECVNRRGRAEEGKRERFKPLPRCC